MPTSSISKQIIIHNNEEAKALLNALEKSRKSKINEPQVHAMKMSKKTIAKIFKNR